MREHHVTDDPCMPLSKWQDLIDQLITEHGPQTTLTSYIFNYSHTRLIVRVPEPPKRKPDGEYKNWGEYLLDAEKGRHFVRFDQLDRYCATMHQLFRARQEGTFPIRYWLKETDRD